MYSIDMPEKSASIQEFPQTHRTFVLEILLRILLDLNVRLFVFFEAVFTTKSLSTQTAGKWPHP